jgi:hypothetical protein
MAQKLEFKIEMELFSLLFFKWDLVALIMLFKFSLPKEEYLLENQTITCIDIVLISGEEF